jgi:hypothetical protein
VFIVEPVVVVLVDEVDLHYTVVELDVVRIMVILHVVLII